MSHAAESIVLAVFIIATSIWVGGYIAIAVVAQAALRTLDAAMRVAFFRSLGRMYFWVGTPALIVALASGAVLARGTPKHGLYAAVVSVAAVLLASFAIAVAQARRMTRLRQSLISAPTDASLQTRVQRTARSADGLRAALGILSLALVVMGAFLAVS